MQANQDLTLLTLVFPELFTGSVSAAAPVSATLPMINQSGIELLPSSRNLLSPISPEKTLALSMPSSLAQEFVAGVRELPVSNSDRSSQNLNEKLSEDGEAKKWMMSAIKGQAADSAKSWKVRVLESWNAFVDVLKVGDFSIP